jgi:uncharacterized protein (TIGR02246 family)
LLDSKDVQEITGLLQSYRDALVSSSSTAAAKLYTKDAWLSAQGFPIVQGKDNIKTWYDQCFTAITLDVTFDVKEVVVTSDTYAFATTTSEGTQKVNASGSVSQEANHELFVIEKEAGEWKLARYCFSTSKSA